MLQWFLNKVNVSENLGKEAVLLALLLITPLVYLKQRKLQRACNSTSVSILPLLLLLALPPPPAEGS